MKLGIVLKPFGKKLVGLIITATAITSSIAFYSASKIEPTTKQTSQPIATKISKIEKVTALGYLQPATEVIRIAAPLSLDNDRLSQLLVRQGDRVKKGQVIAILDSDRRLHSAVAQAEKQVYVANYKLAQVKAGAKIGEINAQKANILQLQAQLQQEIATQKAEITRRQAEVNNARAEYDRFYQLYQAGATTASILDRKQLDLDTSVAQLNQAKAQENGTIATLQAQITAAKANLERIVEVRPVDVQTAQAEVDTAIAALQQAKINLDQVYIKAPIEGQILKVHTFPGEKIQDAGIAEIGETKQMEVVAEIYQTEINRIKVGQKAAIVSPVFEGELSGVVSEIGLQVNKQNVFRNQPGENLDRRVVEVKVLLNPEASQKVASLTNLQVQTAIHL